MAVPNPERELERLQRRVATGLAPVTVVTGPSAFFRGEALDRIVAAVPSDRDLRRLDGQQPSADGRELDDLRGGTLFGGGTILLVRRAEKWLAARGDELQRQLAAVGRGCGLVIEAAKFDKRTKIGKALAATDCYEFRDLYAEPYDRSRSPLDAELVGWVAQRSRSHGVAMNLEAAYVVIATVGKDPAELVGELRRLGEQPELRAAAKSRPLAAEQLRGRLTCAFESTPFELAEAVLDHDRARCMRSLDAMFARGVRGRDGTTVERGGVFPFVASWLHQAVANAHRGRVLLDGGVPQDQIAGQLGVRVFAERFVRQVVSNPEPRLRAALALLLQTQRALRTTGEDPRRLLEGMLARYFRVEP
jgi:DNA polymerase III delta subunit